MGHAYPLPCMPGMRRYGRTRMRILVGNGTEVPGTSVHSIRYIGTKGIVYNYTMLRKCYKIDSDHMGMFRFAVEGDDRKFV